jgi:S-adenosylmethionine:tRNA ribosyltransferase-isomerase
MVSHLTDNEIEHACFRQLPDYLAAGDLLVINSSATINAAFDVVRTTLTGSAERVLLHLSTPLSDERWVVELRRMTQEGSEPLLTADVGDVLWLAGGAQATLVVPLIHDQSARAAGARLWIAEVSVPGGTLAYADDYGSPIRYRYVPKKWPLSYYQTVFAREPGSVEMPSAARPFTSDIVRRLEVKGVRIAPIVLHAGVSSLDADELPYPEKYSVPRATAEAVNAAHAAGARVIAVGTTVVRALESAAASDGTVRAAAGWTNLVITPSRGVRAVDALLTGFHAPNASHLWMLEALASHEHLAACYDAALRQRYLWHEFGDLHLIIPWHESHHKSQKTGADPASWQTIGQTVRATARTTRSI